MSPSDTGIDWGSDVLDAAEDRDRYRMALVEIRDLLGSNAWWTTARQMRRIAAAAIAPNRPPASPPSEQTQNSEDTR